MRYTQEELEAAFRLVQNGTHWKGPVKAIVSAEQLGVTVIAVAWFTGTPCTVEPAVDPSETTLTHPRKDTKFVITSIGYAAGPAGDH